MNRQQTIEAIKVMQAWVGGKEVECAEVECAEVDKLRWGLTISPAWNWLNYTYRIKSTTKLRPWTADEVPLGAWIRSKMHSWKCIIIEVDKRGRIGVNGGNIPLDYALQNNEHSLDNGKTWLPCGVMEEKE